MKTLKNSLNSSNLNDLKNAQPAQITLDGIEIVQVVQKIDNAVLLVANKHTLTRVYLSIGSEAPVTVRGILSIRRSGTEAWVKIPSMTDVVLEPADNGAPGLRKKRENLALSLNFILPVKLLDEGKVQYQLQSCKPSIQIPHWLFLPKQLVKSLLSRLLHLGFEFLELGTSRQALRTKNLNQLGLTLPLLDPGSGEPIR